MWPNLAREIPTPPLVISLPTDTAAPLASTLPARARQILLRAARSLQGALLVPCEDGDSDQLIRFKHPLGPPRRGHPRESCQPLKFPAMIPGPAVASRASSQARRPLR
jgi:hypothetical protein